MNPTITDDDLLEVSPYWNACPKVGDVVFFTPPADDDPVIHRIVRSTTNGFVTKGDNCSNTDPWLLSSTDMLGRVVAAWRGQERRSIAGGRAGLVIVCLVRWRRILAVVGAPLLRPIYHRLAKGKALSYLVPNGFKPRVVNFKASHKTRSRVLLGNLVVGEYCSSRGQWHIRRPFRLFIDESSLPGSM